MTRMASVSWSTLPSSIVCVSTGSRSVTVNPPMGRRERTCRNRSDSASRSRVCSRTDESGSDAARNGITVRSKDGVARTSTSVRPVSGRRPVTPSAESRVPPGSISTTISSPGCMTVPGITAFAERARSPSSNPVGIVADWAGMSTTCVSVPSTKKRARTSGRLWVVVSPARTNTRSKPSLPATSGTGKSTDWTACVTYATDPSTSPQRATCWLSRPASQSRNTASRGAHSPVFASRSSLSQRSDVREVGRAPRMSRLFVRSSVCRAARFPSSAGIDPVSRFTWSRRFRRR